MKIAKITGIFILAASLIASCGKEDTTVNTTSANVMLIHASPNAPAIDVYDDTAKINSAPLPYGSATNYLSILTGSKSVTVKQAGTGTVLFSSAAFSFVKDKSYSVFIVDSAAKATALRLEDNLATPASGKINFRILHLSPNTANVDFILRSGPDSIPVTNKAFKQIPDLLAIDGKTYTIRAKLAGTQTVVATATDIVLTSGKVYTLFLRGFSGGAGAEAPGIGIIANK